MQTKTTWANAEITAMLEEEARGLLDDPPGTNSEYERALCELIARVSQRVGLAGSTGETARLIGERIGASWEKGL